METIGRRLGRDAGLLRRYGAPDDFCAPTVAGAVCTFRDVDALAAIGGTEQARATNAAAAAPRYLGLRSLAASLWTTSTKEGGGDLPARGFAFLVVMIAYVAFQRQEARA